MRFDCRVGMTKEYQETVWARGWADDDRTICSGCVVDEALIEAILETAGSEPCDFCHEIPTSPTASAPIEVVLALVLDGLRYEYEDPNQGVAWDNGWQGASVQDTGDLLWELEITDREDVHHAIWNAIGQTEWCQRDPYAVTPTQALTWGWQEFSRFVKHRRRYTFFIEDETPGSGAGELPVHKVLDAVAEAVEASGLVTTLPEGSEWWRARVHDPGVSYTLAKDIGSPPAQIAKDNRMSPKGISVFYGASSKAGAKDEVAGYAKSTDQATIGCFTTTASVTVVDLRDPPFVPSLFSVDRHLRAARQFLRSFIADVTKVAVPSDVQNLDYVPSQIVAEYFSQGLDGTHGPVGGVIWRSSKDSSVTSCVLVIPNEEVADNGQETADTRLVLNPKSVMELAAPLAN